MVEFALIAADPKGFMDYLPLINLGALIVGIIAAFLMLKLALAAFQTSVQDLKADLKALGCEMRDEFEKFSEKLSSLSERVTKVETVGTMLGRKPHS